MRPRKNESPVTPLLRQRICELHRQGVSVRKALIILGHPFGLSTGRKIIMQDVYKREDNL